MREGTERNLRAVGGFDVEVFQSLGILLELRINFEDDVILVQLRKDGGDLALAVGVVERIVDVGRENAEARRGVTVNHQRGKQALVQLVAGDVAQLRERFQLVHEARSPVCKLFRVDVFEAVLELRAADAIFDGQVLNRLQEERDAVNFGKLRLKAANHVGSANFALGQRSEVDLKPAGVERGIGAVNADERGKAFDGGIFQNHIYQSLLAPRHSSKRNILRSIGDTDNDAGVLHRKETFGHVDIKQNGADERPDGNQQRGGAIAQHKLQRAAIKGDHRVEGVFRLAIEPALFFFFLMAEKLGGHHGREREGDECGNQNRDGQGDGKFAEKAANDVAHEEQRNEHGNQRDGQRDDGEADLLGTF